MTSDKNFKQKTAKNFPRASFLESLKDLGGSTSKSLKNDLLKEGSKDFMQELLGLKPRQRFSGEILPGEHVGIDEILSGEREQKEKLELQLVQQKRIHEEEKALIEKKSNELKMQINAISREVIAIAKVTPKLAREVEIAAIMAPINPGIYHITFFEKLLEFIKSFRMKLEDASLWLHTTNKRASKKSFWSQYKVQGGKRLLSAEDYSGRAAA